MTTSALERDKGLHLQGEILMTSTNLSALGLCGYDSGRIINHQTDNRMVPIVKKNGNLYVDGKIVHLTNGNLLARHEHGCLALSASISDFLVANPRFIPLTWKDYWGDLSRECVSIGFQGTTWVSGENHAFRIIQCDNKGNWIYSRRHDTVYCGGDQHGKISSAYIEV